MGSRYNILREVLHYANPAPHLLDVPYVVLRHSDVGFEEVVEGVEGSGHWVDDEMSRLVEEQTGLFVVCANYTLLLS